MKYSMQVIDESTGRQLSGESLATVGDSNFKAFVTSISKYVVDKFGESAQCGKNSEVPANITLFFVYRPLIAAKTAPVSPPIVPENLISEATCYLDSPWAKLAISRSPKLSLYAVFAWNERQFLLDQALLAGADASHTESPASIEEQVFEKYVQDYTDSVLLVPSSEAQTNLIHISERIPSDVLWLFRHAWQSTFAPFSMEARHTIGLTLTHATQQYMLLVETLVNQCFVPEKIEKRYNNILELNGVFNINQYRIDNIH